MGVPTSEVGYTPAMPRREDHVVHRGHVVALGGGGDIPLLKHFESYLSFIRSEATQYYVNLVE